MTAYFLFCTSRPVKNEEQIHAFGVDTDDIFDRAASLVSVSLPLKVREKEFTMIQSHWKGKGSIIYVFNTADSLKSYSLKF